MEENPRVTDADVELMEDDSLVADVELMEDDSLVADGDLMQKFKN